MTAPPGTEVILIQLCRQHHGHERHHQEDDVFKSMGIIEFRETD